jgi:hypothetical protein
MPATPHDVPGGACDCIAGRDRGGPGSVGGEEDAVSELDRLEAALGECREMIREAHAATKGSFSSGVLGQVRR